MVLLVSLACSEGVDVVPGNDPRWRPEAHQRFGTGLWLRSSGHVCRKARSRASDPLGCVQGVALAQAQRPSEQFERRLRNLRTAACQRDGEHLLPWGTPAERLSSEVQERLPFDWVLAADCSYDFVKADIPSPSIEALLTTARSFGKRALICVSRRQGEVEAFTASLARMGLADVATVVFTAKLDEVKEGVAECLVYAFDFSNSQRLGTKRRH
ncbi:unnamed protein product [Effrenium voratum]|nr:unnamed protein product [Effrenium voratum]